MPVSLDTLRIILLPALAIAMVGLLESVLTAAVVDELTDTPSDKNRECAGLGVANIAASLLWRHCGLRNDRPGRGQREVRRARAPSTLFAGVFLLILMVALKHSGVAGAGDRARGHHGHGVGRDVRLEIARRPGAPPAPVQRRHAGHRGRHHRHPQPGGWRGRGRVLSGVFFAFKVSRTLDVRMQDDAQTGQRTWRVSGQVFFASADAFIQAFDVLGAEGRAVVIDVTHAHFWDITAVAALDKVVKRLRHHGCTVQVVGLNAASAVLIDRMGSDGVWSGAMGGEKGGKKIHPNTKAGKQCPNAPRQGGGGEERVPWVGKMCDR